MGKTVVHGILHESRLLFTRNLMLIFELGTKLLLSLHFVVLSDFNHVKIKLGLS